MLDRASDVHHFALVATAESLRAALAHERAPSHAPASLALRAVNRAFESDVPGAVALLRRALHDRSAASDDAAYLSDLLAQFLVSTGDFASLADVLRDWRIVPADLASAKSAIDAILQAVVGDLPASRVLARKSISSAREAGAPRTLGRVLCRCALAAYYRGDYDEARELALEAARELESEAAYWSAAASYSVAASIAQDWNQNGELAAAYFARMLNHAERVGHNALRRTALAACFNVAAEMFDEASHADARALLIARPERQQHQENYVIVIAEVLGFGWKGEFAAAEAILTASAAMPGISERQRALGDAFLALIAAANGDAELARTRVRTALERAAHAKHEPLHERRYRALARLLSAAACFVIGDADRAKRALSARYGVEPRYREFLVSFPIDLARCPELFRGYAAFINAVSDRALAVARK